jgi:hypothetical protein
VLKRFSTVLWFVLATLAAVAAVPVPRATADVSTGDPVIAASGDIACDPSSSNFHGGLGTSSVCRQQYTSDLLVNQTLSAVLPLGDLQYECAGAQAFASAYDPSWGRVKSISHPVPGNHEYSTSGGTDCDTTGKAAGYFNYFGAAAGDPAKGYYSYDIGAWHVIALNANCSKVRGCGSGKPEEVWLKNDLATHPALCTLAYWHQPRFSSNISSPASASAKFWNDLYNAGADVVLNGHIHNYERFAPQTPAGVADPVMGIREFVVGVGGRSAVSISGTPAANSEIRGRTFGVLDLTLHPDSYDWQFVPEAGKTFADSGSTPCH